MVVVTALVGSVRPRKSHRQTKCSYRSKNPSYPQTSQRQERFTPAAQLQQLIHPVRRWLGPTSAYDGDSVSIDKRTCAYRQSRSRSCSRSIDRDCARTVLRNVEVGIRPLDSKVSGHVEIVESRIRRNI